MENFQQTTCLPLLRSSYNGLTKSEQKLADYILKKCDAHDHERAGGCYVQRGRYGVPVLP